MADDEKAPSLHIDTDWKKQAQEEKRKLAEAEKQKAAASTATAVAPESTGAGPRDPRGAPRGSAAGAGRQRELPPASFATLVQTLLTQALFYLGGIATRGGEPVIDLDLAKHQIDLLAVLEGKAAGNLSTEEKQMLDGALYESRMRFISVASQYIS